ncbi:tetratricopeptide repeat protein [Coralloluteibacterium thermophilus]|uniref:Type IV pilus biogenesis/stability protein PilW n=1 Tax=Coralloluteibacterium thermophilum TaxID=2707049 RepID=A0ABV9NG66_9GAMM
MQRMLRATLLGGLGLAMAMPFVSARPTAEPPDVWRDHLEAVRAADGITNQEARCRAYPDLPHNRWRPGAALARCTLLREPMYTLERIGEVLGQADGAAQLERDFAALLQAHYTDQEQREQIFVAFRVFDHTPKAGEVARSWHDASPGSAFATMALATHHAAIGWRARGGALASRVSHERFERMHRQFEHAVPLYGRVLTIEPRLSVACVKLMEIGAQVSDELEAAATEHCLSVDPDSYHVAYQLIRGAQPRWGGSDAALRHAVAYAAARVERNPILGALLGEAAGDEPSMASDRAAAADALASAAAMAPSGGLLRSAGLGYREKDDPWRALVYLSQSTRFWPTDADYFSARGRLLFEDLDDAAWARADLLRALQLEPDGANHHYTLGRILQRTDGYAAARPHFRFAMEHGQHKQTSHELYCQTFIETRHVSLEMEQCTAELVRTYPESGEAWRLRAWALYPTRHPDTVDAIDRFLLHADMSKPWNAGSMQTLLTWRHELVAEQPALPDRN